MRDPKIHEEVLLEFVKNASELGFAVKDISFSPIRGPEGNIEYLGYLTQDEDSYAVDIERVVAMSHEDLK